MQTWQRNLAIQAEEAANFCIACGQYGHYPVKCPRERHPQLAAPKERPSTLYALLLGLVIGFVAGLCVMKGLM
jgi:hypothetical protein